MDVIKILEKLEELHLIRLYRIIGDYYQIYCPIHNDGNEKRPSCGVLIHEQVRNGQVYPEGFCHCFACQLAVTLPELISQILQKRGLSNQSGLEWLKENIPGFEEPEFDYLIPRDTVKKLNNNWALNYVKSKTTSDNSYVSESELASYRFTTQYMYDRKLTDEVINKFDVGVDLNFVPPGRVRKVPCITFPVKDESGNTLFIYRRAIEKKQFYMPMAEEKPIYGLYELPKDIDHLIICESIFNCLTCYVYGHPAIALLGTGTTKQISRLKLLNVKEYILGLDPDDAGERGRRKLKKHLQSIAIVRSMHLPEGKDINDLNQTEFEEIYSDRY